MAFTKRVELWCHPAGGTNRVAVTKAVAVQSVNGPRFTLIRGYQMPGTTNGPAAIRCAYLTNGASLSGFTLTNGATLVGQSGGGAYGGTLNNCTLTRNSADYEGGGAYGGTLKGCALTGNKAMYGGGAAGSALNNCTLTDNSTPLYGGGAYGCTLNYCTLTGNSASAGGGAFPARLTTAP